MILIIIMSCDEICHDLNNLFYWIKFELPFCQEFNEYVFFLFDTDDSGAVSIPELLGGFQKLSTLVLIQHIHNRNCILFLRNFKILNQYFVFA